MLLKTHPTMFIRFESQITGASNGPTAALFVVLYLLSTVFLCIIASRDQSI